MVGTIGVGISRNASTVASWSLSPEKVRFNRKSATFTVVKDSSEVTADVPAGAATGEVAITAKGGSATSATSLTVN